jgi:hypothetical protein
VGVCVCVCMRVPIYDHRGAAREQFSDVLVITPSIVGRTMLVLSLIVNTCIHVLYLHALRLCHA